MFSKRNILDAIAEMSVLEVVDLSKAIQEKFGEARDLMDDELTMRTRDKHFAEYAIRRIDKLFITGIFDSEHLGHPLQNSAFIELMVLLRDLLAKCEKFASRIDFTDDIWQNDHVTDVTDAVKAIRDACCHVGSYKQKFDATSSGAFIVAMGKTTAFRINELELSSQYEDDAAFVADELDRAFVSEPGMGGHRPVLLTQSLAILRGRDVTGHGPRQIADGPGSHRS